eukprot:scaffold80862_cov64-Phaeocystis_antarctica.AAC.8
MVHAPHAEHPAQGAPPPADIKAPGRATNNSKRKGLRSPNTRRLGRHRSAPRLRAAACPAAPTERRDAERKRGGCGADAGVIAERHLQLEHRCAARGGTRSP